MAVNRYSKIVQNPYKSVVPFNAIQTAMENRQQRYDAVQAGLAKKRDAIYNTPYIDEAAHNQQIKKFEAGVDEILNKYNNDLSLAQDDVVNFIGKFQNDGYNEKNRRQVEAVDLMHKMAAQNPGLVFYDNPATKSLSDYANPGDIKVGAFDPKVIMALFDKQYGGLKGLHATRIEKTSKEEGVDQYNALVSESNVTEEDAAQIAANAFDALSSAMPEEYRNNPKAREAMQPFFDAGAKNLVVPETRKVLGLSSDQRYLDAQAMLNLQKKNNPTPTPTPTPTVVPIGSIGLGDLYGTSKEFLNKGINPEDPTFKQEFAKLTFEKNLKPILAEKDKNGIPLWDVKVNDINGKRLPLVSADKNKNVDYNKTIDNLETAAKATSRYARMLREERFNLGYYADPNVDALDTARGKIAKERFEYAKEQLANAQRIEKALIKYKSNIENYFNKKVGDFDAITYGFNTANDAKGAHKKDQIAANARLNNMVMKDSFNFIGDSVTKDDIEAVDKDKSKSIKAIAGNSYTGIHFIIHSVDSKGMPKDYITNAKDAYTFNDLVTFTEDVDENGNRIPGDFRGRENYKEDVKNLITGKPVVKGSKYIYERQEDGSHAMIKEDGNYFTNKDWIKKENPKATIESIYKVLTKKGLNPDGPYIVDKDDQYLLIELARK